MENKIPPQVVIGEKMLSAHPELEKILPKEKTEEEKKIEVIHSKDIDKNKIVVPDIFFWVDYDFFEKPVIMTAAFKYKMFLFGESWKIDAEWSNRTRREYEKKLMAKMVDSLGLLVHFGDKILDKLGNIDPVKAEDLVAERYWLDKLWKARIEAFHKVVKVKAINVVKAKELGLL